MPRITKGNYALTRFNQKAFKLSKVLELVGWETSRPVW